MVDYVYTLNCLNNLLKVNSSKELKEKDNIISELSATLEKTIKNLEKIKKENKILQENISKIYNDTKVEFNKKTNRIIELEKLLDKYYKKYVSLQQNERYKANEDSSRRKRKIETERDNSAKKLKENRIGNPKKDEHKEKRRRSHSRHHHRRSRTRSKEKQRAVTPNDLRNHLNHVRHSRSRNSPEPYKSRNQRDEEYFERETRKMLQKIRKNQVKAVSSNTSSPENKIRKFVEANKTKNDTRESEGELSDIFSNTSKETDTHTEECNKNKEETTQEEIVRCKQISEPEKTDQTETILNIFTDNSKEIREDTSTAETKNENNEDGLIDNQKNQTNILEDGEISNDSEGNYDNFIVEDMEISSDNEGKDNIIVLKDMEISSDNEGSNASIILENKEISSDNEENNASIILEDKVISSDNEENKDAIILEDGEVSNDIFDNDTIILEDAEISNDIFDDLTQILNELQEEEPELDEPESKNVNSPSNLLSDISVEEIVLANEETTLLDPFATNPCENVSNNNCKIKDKRKHENGSKHKEKHRKSSHKHDKNRNKLSKKKPTEKLLECSSISSNDSKCTMKYEDPFNTKDWRDDPLTYVPKKWKDMRIYDELPYVDDRKKSVSYDVEAISSDCSLGSISPDCPF